MVGWKTGFWDCCGEPGGPMLFCKGYLCAPWVFGETVAMLDNGEHICAGNCVGGCISTGIPCLNAYSLCTARQAIRKKYNIDGGCHAKGRWVSLWLHGNCKSTTVRCRMSFLSTEKR